MQVSEDLLKPISQDHPTGWSVRYDPVYDKIKQARRQDDGGVVPGAEPKAADHKTAVVLATEVIATRSKDLQVAVWLTDSLIQREGFAGLRDGLDLVNGLIANYWDGLYPQVEDGDLEMRAAPLDWMGNYLELAKESSPVLSVRFVPLTTSGLQWLQYQESRKPGTAEGRISAELFDADVDATPKAFYKQRAAELASCLESLDRLGALCDEKFGKAAPGFFKLRTALEEIRNTVAILLKRKPEQEPDPAEPFQSGTNGIPAVPFQGAPDELVAAAVGVPIEFYGDFTGLEPQSRQEALARIVSAARYLRKLEPSNPAPYMILRALRWGELRARGPELDTSLLAAPATDLRTRMKSLATAGRWADLLELTESATAAECGRGWLDLQRYSVIACDQLGYSAAARAIRSELSCLLADFPALAKATLLDDTGAANPETSSWLDNQILKKSG